MWTPEWIRLENFKSHRKTVYDFNKGATTIVYGLNKDVNNPTEESNGTGKSSLIEGIVVALLDIPDRDIDFDDYILDGESEALVVMLLTNTFTKETMQIERFLYKKKSNAVALYFNDVLDQQITGVPEANAKILEKLEISKEDLLNFFLIRQKKATSFFMSTDQRKKKLIGKFCAEEQIYTIIEKLQSDYTELDTHGLGQANEEVMSITSKIEALQEQVDELVNEDSSDNSDLIKEKREKIVRLKGERQSIKEEIDTANANISKLLEKVEKKNFESKIEKSNFAIAKLREERDETIEVLSYLNSVLAGVVECPKCSYRFNPNEDADVEEAEQLKQEAEEAKSSLIDEIKQAQEKLKKLEAKQEKAEELQSNIDELKRQLKRKERRVEDIDEDIVSVKKSIARLEEDTGGDNSTQITKLKSTITKLNIELRKAKKERAEIEAEMAEISNLVDMFGVKGFHTYLINKTLGSIERNVNIQLKDFDTDLAVQIEGYTTLKSGEVRERIEVKVTKDGTNFKKFGRFSGGQKARVDLSGVLVFQRIINNSCKNGGLDLLCLDEYMESLDLKGQRMIVPLLENTGITTLVVSHMNYDIGFEHETWLEYVDGETYLRND